MMNENETDMEVVIAGEEGLYLYRDGRTFGPCPVLACKYLLHADRVEEQIRTVKELYGARWHWVEYSSLATNE